MEKLNEPHMDDIALVKLWFSKLKIGQGRKFLKFLLRKDAYIDYVSNLIIHSRKYYRDKYETAFNNSMLYVIDSSFTWQITPQGHLFWKELHNKNMSLNYKYQKKRNKRR